MEVSSSYAQALFPMVLLLRKRAVPFEVGKPVVAHAAAEAMQERIDPYSHGGSPSCFFMALHGKIPSFKRSLNLFPPV